jgi:lambda family phage portal protein
MGLRATIRNFRQHFLPDVRSMMRGDPANSYEVGKLQQYLGHLGRFYLGAHYDASNTGRLNSDWSSSYDTPYTNYRDSREVLIARSIRMVDNNPNAKAILEQIVADSIGTGIKPQPRVKFAGGEPIKGLNDVLTAGWERYNDEWDATRQATFYDIQATALREIITSGAVLSNKVRGTDATLGVKSQLVPVLRLDCSHDAENPGMGDDPRVKQTAFGINLSADGEPLSYWIQGINKPISADYMHQTYRRLKAEEHTGTPWFVAALKYLWANEELTKDKLIASRIQAMIGMIMPNKMWSQLAPNSSNADGQLEFKSGRVYHYDAQSGGKPEILQADDSIQNVLIPLQRLLMHSISVSLGWSYQTVTRDVSEINMAAGKINTNKDHQAAEMIQRWFSKSFCQYEWEYFVRRMFLTGEIPGKSITDYLTDPWRYTQCQWRAPGWDFVDPYREAQAVKVLRDGGLMTLEKWYGNQGVDWHDAIDQIAVEQEYMKSKKVELPDMQPKAAPVSSGATADGGEGQDASDNVR